MKAAVPFVFLLAACASHRATSELSDVEPSGSFGERTRVLALSPGVTATLVAPARLDTRERIDLIIYALPNGNSTAQTIGRKLAEGVDWHYDIQHIGAQSRALRTRGYSQAIVAYLEADSKSWPAWRRTRGYEKANSRIVEIVDEIRGAIGDPSNLSVTLAGHSGGGSFMFGFIEARDALPVWLERIVFLDANYNFEKQHGDKLVEWLFRDKRNTLVSLAYDDREIMVDGKKVVSETGGTWRASQRIVNYVKTWFPFNSDKLGEFLRYRNEQVEILFHPNLENRILHTAMIGDMNGYMHAMMLRRPGYENEDGILKSARVYEQWVENDITLPAATPPRVSTPNLREAKGDTQQVTAIAYERTDCGIGTCPAYRVTVKANGAVAFYGIQYTNTAYVRDSISPTIVRGLLERFEGDGFFALDSAYTPRSPACRTIVWEGRVAILTVRAAGRTKRVEHHSGCIGPDDPWGPDTIIGAEWERQRMAADTPTGALLRLEAAVDSTLRTDRWMKPQNR